MPKFQVIFIECEHFPPENEYFAPSFWEQSENYSQRKMLSY